MCFLGRVSALSGQTSRGLLRTLYSSKLAKRIKHDIGPRVCLHLGKLRFISVPLKLPGYLVVLAAEAIISDNPYLQLTCWFIYNKNCTLRRQSALFAVRRYFRRNYYFSFECWALSLSLFLLKITNVITIICILKTRNRSLNDRGKYL